MKIKFVKNYLSFKTDDVAEVGDESADLIAKGYAEEVKANPVDEIVSDLEKRVSEVAERVASETAVKTVEKVSKALSSKRASIYVGADSADSDPKKGFKSLGDFLNTVKEAAYKGGEHPRLKAAGITGAVNADGAFALPPAFNNQLIDGISLNSESLLPRTFNINLSGDGRTMTFPSVKNYDMTSTDATKVAVANWLAEGANKPVSKPQFEMQTLTLKKVAAVLPATDEMLQDVGALESVLVNLGVNAINSAVNGAIIRGNGTTQPTGIIGHASTITVASDEYGITGDVANMLARFYGDRSRAAWIYHPSVFPELVQATVGSYPVFMPQGGISQKPYDTLWGIPMIASEDASEAGSVGDLILADMSKYATLTKGGIDVQSSIHVYFLTDETAFRFVYRVDGKPVYSAPVTPKHGQTRSPFIVRG